MTAVLAIRWDNGALMAGDAAYTSNGIVSRSRSPKVVNRGSYLVGACGEAGYMNVALILTSPRYAGEAPLLQWACETFVPAMRDAMSDLASLTDGCTLLASPGEIVHVDSAGACHDYHRDFAAIGTGSEVALGALYLQPNHHHQERARHALGAASELVESVSPPWSYVTTDGDSGRL